VQDKNGDGSGLNAIPVLSYVRDHPTDEYLLRVGYGGAMGALSNIDQDELCTKSPVFACGAGVSIKPGASAPGI